MPASGAPAGARIQSDGGVVARDHGPEIADDLPHSSSASPRPRAAGVFPGRASVGLAWNLREVGDLAERVAHVAQEA